MKGDFTKKIYKMNDKANEFYKSVKAVWVFSTIATVFGLIQLISFIFLGAEVNGATATTGTQWQIAMAWTVTIVAVVNCWIGFYMGIQNSRGASSFFIWALLTNALSFFINAMAGMWLVNIAVVLSIPTIFIRYIVWKGELQEKEEWSFKKIWWWVYLICAFLFVAFFVLVAAWGEEIYAHAWNSDPEQYRYLWYIDALTAGLTIIANIVLIFKWRQAYFWFTIMKIPLFVLYIESGNIVPLIQQCIYLTMDAGTVMAWTAQGSGKEQKNKELETQDKNVVAS